MRVTYRTSIRNEIDVILNKAKLDDKEVGIIELTQKEWDKFIEECSNLIASKRMGLYPKGYEDPWGTLYRGVKIEVESEP